MKLNDENEQVSDRIAPRQEAASLRSIKPLYGDTLEALDGEIGEVNDFYFDDQNWVIRYVVADVGSWLSGRQVLLTPHAFPNFEQDGVSRPVNLTRQQIQDSPAIALHQPVSRQYEEQHYSYYQRSPYWYGGQMWGMGLYPMGLPLYAAPMPSPEPKARSSSESDPHLRSTQAVVGYKIHTTEGEIGHVTDFVMYTKSWAITHLIVETGHWYAGKEIAIGPKHVERISYEDSKVFLDVTKNAMLEAPEYHAPPRAFNDPQSIAD